MKKTILFLFLFSNIVLLSCSSDNDNETSSNTSIEVITTYSSPSITSTSVIAGGMIEGLTINDFSNGIALSGLCWSTNTNPTIDNFVKTENVKYFEATINSLTPNTTYYFRAYVEVSGEVTYGNEVVITTDEVEPVLGANYMGGKIVYIYPPSHPNYVPNETHGLIAAIDNQIVIGSWGCDDIVCGQTSTALGTGLQNTERIVNVCGANTAAGVCYNLDYNGFNDWFLPSKEEMTEIYEYLSCYDMNGNYWTSSEVASNAAWIQPSDCYGYDNPTPYAKEYLGGNLKALPVREF